MSSTKQVCTFYLGNECYGIEVESVQEVIANQMLTRIPLAPPAVVGLMNIRGQIISAISVRRAMRMESDQDLTESTILVIRRGGLEVGMLVDRIGDIIEVVPEEMEQAPDTVGETIRDFIAGVVSLEGELLLILDLEHLLNDELCLRAQLAEAGAA